MPGWRPAGLAPQRLTVGPRHYLADPVMTAQPLGCTAGSLLTGRCGPVPLVGGRSHLGVLYEAAVSATVRSMAEINGCAAFHLRTSVGRRRVDVIVRAPMAGSWASRRGWAGMPPKPIFVTCVGFVFTLPTGSGTWPWSPPASSAYRRRDGIAVVPLALPGP